jgi:DNA-binding transcriptional LysR family regulator
MDRIEAMALFVTAIETGSLSAAARRHGRSPASVTRAVALLEADAGETLLLRSTRKLSLTTAGERHLAVWKEVLEKLGGLRRDDHSPQLRGNILLTAPELFGQTAVMPLIETFLAAHPLIAVRALLVNRVVNLVGEGVDVAVRLAPLADTMLTAVRIGEVRTLLCASPTYLAEAGVPTTPTDLEGHACIGLDVTAEAEQWAFSASRTSARRRRAVRIAPRLSVNSMAAAIDAAIRGQGIVQARSYQVAEAMADGRLRPLLPSWEPPRSPAHLVFSPERAAHPSVRALIDHLKRALPPVFANFDRLIGQASELG